MNSFVIIHMALLAVFVIGLLAFAAFAVGFLIGYKVEEKRIVKRKQIEVTENDREKKAKKEWKKFLEYDGSVPKGEL